MSEKSTKKIDITIFKPNPMYNFRLISIDKFIKRFQKDNPGFNTQVLKDDLNYFKQLKSQGHKYDCGIPLWIIGSAVVGKGCFMYITGGTDASNDYELR